MNYLDKAIEIQNHAYRANFAVKKLAQSCDTMVKLGLCHHKDCGLDCDNCKLQQAHNRAIREIDEGIRQVPVVDCENIRYERRQYWDGKGHHTAIWRAPIKVKEG